MKAAILSSVSLAALVAAPLASQSTWIVDAAGGAGSDFRTIAAAIARASENDRIVVRKGVYPTFSASKAVKILGESGAVVDMTDIRLRTHISSIGAGKTFVLRGITFKAGYIAFPIGALVSVTRCAGRVVIEGVAVDKNSWFEGLSISECRAVTLERCRMGRMVRVTDSHVVGVDTQFALTSVYNPIAARNSTLRLIRCQAVGGIGPHAAAFSAITCHKTLLDLRGAGSSYAGGLNFGSRASALTGDGSSVLLLDPQVSLTTPKTLGFKSIRTRRVPWLIGSGGQLGGKVELRFGSHKDHPYFGFVGVPSAPIAIPGWGDLWIDPRLYARIAQGTQGATEQLTLQRNVPNIASLVGLSITYQFLSGKPRLEFSNASTVTLFR